MLYLSVCGDDDLSQVVVHGGHGLADGVQGHVHLPLHPVAVGEQAHQLHDDLHAAKKNSIDTRYNDSQEKVSRMLQKSVQGCIASLLTQLCDLVPHLR